MFSFFKSKNKGSDSSPESEPIPGPTSGGDHDGFEVINNRPQPHIYPPLAPLGPQPGMPPMQRESIQREAPPVNYLHGVPFKLSAELTKTDNSDMSRMQVDEILSSILRASQMNDYDFSLERGIIQT